MPTEAQLTEAMRTAIAASEAVRGTTSPNPPVGAVILDSGGRTVGVGATQPPGGPHAEVMAVRAAGDAARGGTAVVTLEPCAHTGRTPPCTDLLTSVGVAEVYFAVADPNPVAAGGGQVLADAGVPVRQGLLAQDVERGPLRAWLHCARTGRPHVTWKYAMSMDGRVAAADGTSRWISGPESRAEVHALRRAVDAIIAGTGTVRVDDPRLTARDADGALLDRQPLRVVVGLGDLPEGAAVTDDAAETIHLRTREPGEVLATLAARGVVDVLLEGGPTLAGAFLRAGLVDRVLAYLAPKLLGSGPAALGDAGVATITQAHLWTVEGATMNGPDVRVSAIPVREAG
jgi:diaminohydroxyphosphoribosylaminopyrimidine deaminase/5-amino-6-(5-phosphoribosylamino)uracil reductase